MKRFKVALIASDFKEVPEWVYKKFVDAGIDFIYKNCFTEKDLQSMGSDADVLFIQSSRKGLIVERNMNLFKNAGCVIKYGSK